MPSYPATPPVCLHQGRSLALVNNAAVDGSVTTTIQCAIGPTPGSDTCTVTAINGTNQTATGQFAQSDVAANYQPLSGFVVPSGSALPYNLPVGWIRFTFTVAPTTGSLTVMR